MINLFETYNTKARDLEYSIKCSGYNSKTIVLQDNGFLPDHVESPIKFFSQSGDPLFQGDPLFFNELEIPMHWEINGNNREAEIFEGYKQKGKINYSQRKGDFRLIQSVEWWNDQGKCRAIDLYNKEGRIFGHKTYSDGSLSLTTYYDLEGREVILHNHIVDTIQVNYKNKIYIFDSYTSFILFYFRVAKLDIKNINYNSLGIPYFITLALENETVNVSFAHNLFWQEISSAMPGNMKSLMQSRPNQSTQKIFVQDKEEYKRLCKQITFNTNISMSYLGLIYQYRKRKDVTSSILIFTSSDQVENLQYLSDSLQDVKFNIASRTEMSNKLLKFGEKGNINLFPNVSTNKLKELLNLSSIYLDINYGQEVENIIRQAFEYEEVILSFKETLHNPRYVSSSCIFEKEKPEDMIGKIEELIDSKDNFITALNKQKIYAGHSTIQEYRRALNYAQ